MDRFDAPIAITRWLDAVRKMVQLCFRSINRAAVSIGIRKAGAGRHHDPFIHNDFPGSKLRLNLTILSRDMGRSRNNLPRGM